MQKLVRGFVNQCCEFFRLRLTGQQCDSAAIRNAKRGCDIFAVLQLDSTRDNELSQAVEVLADFAGGLTKRGQRCTFCLRLIPHVHTTKTEQRRFVLVVVVLFLFLAANSDHGRKNRNTFFATLYATAKFVPRAHTGDVRSRWPLPCNQQDVTERITVKVRHRVKKRGQGFTVSYLQLLDEVLHVFADELLRGGWLPIFTVGSRIAGDCAVAADACKFHCFSPRRPGGSFFAFTLERSGGKNEPLGDEEERQKRG